MSAPVLSERQRALLDRIAEGRSNIEIGRDLGLPDSLVSHDLSILYRKLGARNRAHAVHLAWQYELLGGAS